MASQNVSHLAGFSRWRLFVWISASAFGVLLAALAATAFFVRWLGTPEGSQWALAKLQTSVLAPRGIHLSFAEGQFRLLSGFRFKGLSLRWGDPLAAGPAVASARFDKARVGGPYGGHFRAERAEARYSIAFLARTIDVESFELVRPDIRGTFETTAATDDARPAPADDPQALSRALRSLQGLLRRPPVSLRVASVSIAGLSFDVAARPASTGAGPSAEAKAEGIRFRASLEIKQNQLFSEGELATKELVRLAAFLPAQTAAGVQTQTAGGGAHADARAGAEIALAANASAKWKVDLRERDGRWIHEFGPASLDAGIKGLRARALQQDGSALESSVDSASANAQATARAESAEAFSFLQPGADKDALKASALRASAEASGLRARNVRAQMQRPPARIARARRTSTGAPRSNQILLSVESAHAAANGALGPEFSVELQARAEKIEAPGRLRRAIVAAANANASLPRDLRRARLEGKAEIAPAPVGSIASAPIRVVEWSALLERSAKASEGSAFSAKATIFADRRLAAFAAPLAALEKMGSPSIEASASGKALADGRVDFSSSLLVPRILLPASNKPFSFDFQTDGSWSGADKRLSARATAAVGNAEFGRWKAASKLEAALEDRGFSTQGSTEISELQAGPKAPLALPRPVAIEHRAESGAAGVTAKLKVDAPEAKVPSKATMFGTRAAVEVKAPSLPAAGNGQQPAGSPSRALSKEFSIEASQDRLALDPALASSPAPLEGAKLSLKASVADDGSFDVEGFRASIGGRLAEASGDVRGNYKTKDVLLRILASAEAPANLPAIGGARARGRVAAPIDVSIRAGREISVSGEAEISGGEISRDGISLSGISGRAPFSEKLIFDAEAGAIRFASLIDQNPFERVNFDRLRPLIQSAQQLTIAKIGWMERSYGPFIGYFSIRQNMLFAHQFDFDLGSGRGYGEMFFDVHPKSMRFGLLSRLTGLDLGAFLPQKFLARVPEGDRVVAGRTALVFDLNKNSVDGRVDVTRIGGPQLMAMINVLDPKFEDDKLNTMRSLLQIGYPTGVAIEMRQGYMDMDVDLAAFGLSKRQSVRGIPLSSFIAEKTAEIVRKTKKGPLQ